MTDVHTILQRHMNMLAIKGKNTKPEMVVRHYLWRSGFRYRVNNPKLQDILTLSFENTVHAFL